MLKEIKKLLKRKKLTIKTCPCNTCTHYYDSYDAITGITTRDGEKNAKLLRPFFCSVNMVSLPFFKDDNGNFCPNVFSCTTFEKHK